MEKVVIFSAPSGAGKTTIAKEILKLMPNLEFSISACSRVQREGEKEGVDYYFLTEEEFKTRIERGDFLEWEEVYPGSYYGTLKMEVERIWKKGKDVMFDVDTFGGINIKEMYKDKAISIFIKTLSPEILEERLKSRGTETEESLKKRKEKAAIELSYSDKFDKIIVNDNLERAISEAHTIIKDFLERA